MATVQPTLLPPKVHVSHGMFALLCAVQTTDAKLYDMQTFPVDITNPFPSDCEFSITLIQDM